MANVLELRTLSLESQICGRLVKRKKKKIAIEVENPESLTDQETEGLFFTNALTPREYIFDLGALFNVLPA